MRTNLGSRKSYLESLMERYQQADATAVAELIRIVSPRIYRFLSGQLGNPVEADDLLQEVWLKIHQARHTYRKGQPVLPWFFGIARHVRVDDFRSRRRRNLRETSLENALEPASQPQSSQQASAAEFERLLTALPNSQREVLVMLKVTGLSLEEIARATSSTVGAVKQKAHRAYQRLRSDLSQSAVRAG